MSKHMVYSTIITAVKNGRLKEPFSINNLKSKCNTLAEGTCNVFLYKHRKGNPGGNSELFEMVSKGKFKLIRPIRYGLG